ncbi:hypothetical protein BREVUG8_40190 [Brevundimonas sp. G8]|nr:hypothetical protein BREVUG8_40190 [Brevundimonas sp. G8]
MRPCQAAPTPSLRDDPPRSGEGDGCYGRSFVGPLLARLDQFAAFAQQDQPFLVIDADQDQAAGGVQDQGLDHLKPAGAAFGAELGHELGRIATRGPSHDPDQAEGEGQAEDRPDEIEEIHTLQGPAQSALRGQLLTTTVNEALR